jgi:cobalt-zinc-cadmium efflux system outer membrane protein
MIARAKFSLKVTLVAYCAATCAAAQGLTERQALRLFRESPYHRELQAEVHVVRAGNQRHNLYPNPSVSATFEGAGRTDFFMIEQPLVVNGRHHLLRQAGDSAIRVAETSADHALHQIEARLRRSFYQLAYAQGRQALIRESIGELEALARILRERERAGEGSKFDRLRAELEIVDLETESAETETLIAAARAKLAGFLGERVHPDALSANGTMEAAYELPSLRGTFAEALSARSDYKVETERLEQLRLEGKAANRLRIPNPVVSGGLKRAVVGDRYLNGPVLAVGIDLPLFDKGQVDRALAEAKADRTRARRRILESQILADVRAAHDSLRLRRQIARDYRVQMGKRTRDLLEIAQVAYEEGELGILELLNAFRNAQRTKLRQWELRAAAKLAEVEFDRSVAKELLP